jgi:hypothetical protein
VNADMMELKIHYNKIVQNFKSGQAYQLEALNTKITKLEIELKNIQKNIDTKNNEVVKIESDRKLEDLFSMEIKNIEQDKLLLKKFIDSFINEISIIHHSTKFTLLGINRRGWVESKSGDYLNTIVPEEGDSIIERLSNSILINKTNPKNIRFLLFNQSATAKYLYHDRIGLLKVILTEHSYEQSCEILTFSEIFELFDQNKNNDYLSLVNSKIHYLEKLNIYRL